MASIEARDLRVIAGDDQPRVQDIRLAEVLGFERPRVIRGLIERNKDELERYAKLPCHAAVSPGARGPIANEYWLTEAQAILITMRSDAPNAPDARAELIAVFQAWRHGKLKLASDVPTITGMLDMVAQIDGNVHDLRSEVRAGFKQLNDNVYQLQTKGRKDASVETVRIHGKVIRYHLNGKCPCLECNFTIMDDDGFIDGAWHHHHQNNRNDNRPSAMIPLAIECHRRIESDPEARLRFGSKGFVLFQTLLERMEPKQLKLDV